MILKLQRSITTTAPTPMCLVYNEDRSVMGEFPLLPEVAELFGDRLKFYADCEVVDGNLNLDHEVEAQEW